VLSFVQSISLARFDSENISKRKKAKAKAKLICKKEKICKSNAHPISPKRGKNKPHTDGLKNGNDFFFWIFVIHEHSRKEYSFVYLANYRRYNILL
jgi:hypothetical protein